MLLRKTPVLLILMIVALVALNPVLPVELKQMLYAASLTIKSVIIFFLPFIIFALLFKTTINLSRQATALILMLLLAVCSSNFLSTFLSHYVGEWVYHYDMNLILPHATTGLMPAWQFTFPTLIDNSHAMLAGVVLGLIAGIQRLPYINRFASQMEWLANCALKFIVVIIPIFIAGFIVKLMTDGVLAVIVADYSQIFITIALAQLSYLIFIYLFLNRFQIAATFRHLKAMLPAVIAGFSTMSSAAAMPLTLRAVKKQAKNPELTQSLIPATVNIHLVGDCFAIPIFAYAVMKSFGFDEPSLWQYLIFVSYFVMAKFSVAAIPGGGIIVMLPILEKCLGFNSDMLTLMTALYVLFDPIITATNVLGNGALVSFIDKVVALRQRRVEEDCVRSL